MFDFVRKHTKIMQVILFLLIFPSFVLVGINGYNRFREKGDAVAKVDGHEIQQAGKDRIHGGIAALQKVAPKAQVVARHEGVLAAECLTVTQSLLQAHPDLNVIVSSAGSSSTVRSSRVALAKNGPAVLVALTAISWMPVPCPLKTT